MEKDEIDEIDEIQIDEIDEIDEVDGIDGSGSFPFEFGLLQATVELWRHMRQHFIVLIVKPKGQGRYIHL